MAKRLKPSKDSQHVADGVWFYERPGSLMFVAWSREKPGERRVRSFNVRWSKLAKSAERCGWKLTRVGKRRTKPSMRRPSE